MPRRHLPTFVLLTFTGLLPSLVGCGSMYPFDGNPFASNPDPYDPAIYGPNPQQRIDRLQELAETAAELAPIEQQQLSEQLYRDLQVEESAIARLYLVRTLARLDTRTSTTALMAATGDPDRDVKIAACDALGDRPAPETLRVLAEVLGRDSDVDVRLAATRSLGKYDDPQAVSSLAIALDDADPALQRRAVESLRDVTGEDFGNDVSAWQTYVQGATPAPRRGEREESLADRYLPWR